MWWRDRVATFPSLMLRRAARKNVIKVVAASCSTGGQFLPSYEEMCSPEEKDSERVGLMLHGLMGNSANWRSTVQRVIEHAHALPYRLRIYLVDLRHHGESSLSSIVPQGANTMESCANDLLRLCDSELPCAPHFVIGHSLGGKIALEFAKEAMLPPRKVVCLDSFPGVIPAHQESGPKSSFESISMPQMIAILRDLELPIRSKPELKEDLLRRGFPKSLAIWMTTNVRALDSGGFRWRFNLHALPELYESYKTLSMWDVLQSPPEGCTIDYVRGELSSRWTEQAIAEFEEKTARTPDTRMLTLERSGHWMHVDNNPGLVKILLDSLSNL